MYEIGQNEHDSVSIYKYAKPFLVVHIVGGTRNVHA